ncbi:MFS transporter [Cellulomonas oligotrophica]|uniref:DHA1 family inner membrane transport protein n=1 Tax=Cellulomonas oligotrophica TaxID=931536 RepID=A0A7Y9FD64_9CELL|nr:MFS transporter [Cellulomonas oligotrophica]NYD85120.1 DHA1 family inner membrane transport protein [Cellulomonas oligotrophica]GIG33824.1 MFS transporter [Cellulomonas oligotrophica]
MTTTSARPAPPSAAPGTRPGLALLALALGGFGIGTTEFATMGLLPEIATDLGVDIPTAGHTITAYAVGVVLGAPTLAALGARLDRRRLLLLLMVAFTVGNVASAFAPTAESLVVARLLAGLPHGAYFGVGAVMGTAVVGPARRGRAVASMMAGLTVACAVGVPLAAVVGQSVGWRWAFVGVGALGLVTLAALAAWTPSLPADPAASVRGEVAALRNGPLWVAFGAGAVGFGGMFAVYSYVKPLLTDVTGLDVALVPAVLAAYGVGMTAGTLLGGRLADRSVLGTVVTGMVATIVVLVVIALVGPWAWAAVPAIVLLGVTSQVLGLALQTRLMDLSPDAPSLGAALCHSALNLGNAAGAFLGGLVIAAGWGLLAPAWVGAALTAVGLLVVVTVGRAPAPHR